MSPSYITEAQGLINIHEKCEFEDWIHKGWIIVSTHTYAIEKIWVRKTQWYRDNIIYRAWRLKRKGRLLEEDKHSWELKLKKIIMLIHCMGAEKMRYEYARWSCTKY